MATSPEIFCSISGLYAGRSFPDSLTSVSHATEEQDPLKELITFMFEILGMFTQFDINSFCAKKGGQNFNLTH